MKKNLDYFRKQAAANEKKAAAAEEASFSSIMLFTAEVFPQAARDITAAAAIIRPCILFIT